MFTKDGKLKKNIHENRASEPISERAFALYRPPFRYDGHGYLWDANGEMVADDRPESPSAIGRIRGWGRIGYLKEPEKLQDMVGHLIAQALTEFWQKHAEQQATRGE